MLIASTLCLAVANLPASVNYNPETKTYTVDQYGKKLDKKPSQTARTDQLYQMFIDLLKERNKQ